MFDVTVSVWNRFHSFQLIHGLTAAGENVLGLGTTRRRPHCNSYRCAWTSAFITQASFLLPAFRESLVEIALNRYESFATKNALEAGCFWGWSNHHRPAFEKAKAAAVPIILETGSTHARWAERVLRAEYANGGNERPVITARRMKNMLAEYELADAICVPTSFVARSFISEGVPSKKLHVNPYGVDTDFWQPQAYHPNNEQKRTFTFVYCGQIMLRKGFHYLLQAWQEAALINSELWVVGAAEPACEALLANLPRSVKHLGTMSHDELRELYARADVYVLPSLEEGLARSILEAMAAGLPIIATEATGITDIMVDGEDGWIVPAGDVTLLSTVLREAAHDPPATARRGVSAASRVKPYTWEAYGHRAAAFLKAFMGDR